MNFVVSEPTLISVTDRRIPSGLQALWRSIEKPDDPIAHHHPSRPHSGAVSAQPEVPRTEQAIQSRITALTLVSTIATSLSRLPVGPIELVATAGMRSQVNWVPAFTLAEALQDAAFTYRLVRTALHAQFLQLSLQRLEFFYATRDVPDVPVEQVVDPGTVLIGAVAKIEQRAHFLQRHVQRPAMSDKLQALDMDCLVEPIVA